jgi:hypothetical protein
MRFLYTPEISAAYLTMMSSESANTTLGARVREVVILTVGAA